MTTSAKCPPPDSPHTEPPELDRRVEGVDRSPSRVLRARRSPVHQYVDVSAEQAYRGRDDERRDEQRGNRVSRGEAERGSREPASTASVPARSLPKWSAFASSASLR